MKLSTRMWLSGALVPAVLLSVGLLVAARVFRDDLMAALDQGLLAQAAAESVSLFDRPDGPHLHMAESPLLEAVRPFAPTGELFDAQGRLVAHFPPLPHRTDVQAPTLEGTGPLLSTLETPQGRVRQLVARIARAEQASFVLRLSASMAQIDASVRQFHEVSIAFIVFTTLALMSVQWVFARRLSTRLGHLSAHLARVKLGQLDNPPGPEGVNDEIDQLRAVLAETMVQLQAARASQDRLLADAAHELRTPLTLMRTSLDLALRKERSVEELRTAVSEARTEVDRLAVLASRLLELGAAGRSWDAAQLDLFSVLDESAEAARAEAEQRGTWLEVSGPRPAVARFSAVALRQAVDNLVSNALRFAPVGTPIRLACVPVPDGGWRLTVTDAGPGIPEAQRTQVFAPFHRIDPRGGSGLGLAIVSEVMRLHGGRAFAAVPATGVGTEIVLELPPPAKNG